MGRQLSACPYAVWHYRDAVGLILMRRGLMAMRGGLIATRRGLMATQKGLIATRHATSLRTAKS